MEDLVIGTPFLTMLHCRIANAYPLCHVHPYSTPHSTFKMTSMTTTNLNNIDGSYGYSP